MCLGVIADCDQVFINGVLIGENGESSHSYHNLDSSFADRVGIKGKQRLYKLPISNRNILWDKYNAIAVRVFNKSGKGGMIGNGPFIAMVSLEDSVIFNKAEFYRVDKSNKAITDTNFTISNFTNHNISGEINIKCSFAETGKLIFERKRSLDIKPGLKVSIPVSLPSTTEELKFLVQLTDDHACTTINDVIYLPYVLKNHQP